MKLAEAYRDFSIRFRDAVDPDTNEWVVYATKKGKTGEGRAPYAQPGSGERRHLQATQAAIDDLERKLS
jgi:hypothetical protein